MRGRNGGARGLLLRSLCGRLLQRFIHAGADGGESGRDAADHAGDDGKREGESGDHPVEADAADEGESLGSRLVPTRRATTAAMRPMTPPVTLIPGFREAPGGAGLRRSIRAPGGQRFRARRIARTSRSPARLAQAMSRTTATARKRVRTRERAWAMVSSCRPGTMGAECASWP